MARLNLVAANPQKEIKPRAPKAPRPVVVTPSNDDQKDHFVTKNGLSYAGSHVIIDLWEAKGLDDRERIETALIDGDIAFRQHSAGHTPAPNWPTFLAFASRYVNGQPPRAESKR